MPEVKLMDCIAIVCVLLFWFGYVGILAKLVLPLVVVLSVSAQPDRSRIHPPFRPSILPPSQTLSEVFR